MARVAGGGTLGDTGLAVHAPVYPHSLDADPAGNIFFNQGDGLWIRKIGTDGKIDTVVSDGWADASGLAVDHEGNLFYAMPRDHVIRRLTPQGSDTIVAGNGTEGSFGDGGPATAAELMRPADLAVDGSGNLFISDYDAHRVRRVSTSGVITTVAGNGSATSSGDGGPATAAGIQPWTVAVSSDGLLYVSDIGQKSVRVVRADGRIDRFAGGGTEDPAAGGRATDASLTYADGQGPGAMAVDAAGRLFISDGFSRVYVVDAAGNISAAAGDGNTYPPRDGGPATASGLGQPAGIGFDGSGAMYIAELTGLRIRKVSSSRIISTIAGTGSYASSGDGEKATIATLNVNGMAHLANGDLLIAEWGGGTEGKIHRVDANGILTTFAGGGSHDMPAAGDEGPAKGAYLWLPGLMTAMPDGSVLVAEYNGNGERIRRIDPAGIIHPFAGYGRCCSPTGPALSASFEVIGGMTAAPNGDVYITESKLGQIIKISQGNATVYAGNIALDTQRITGCSSITCGVNPGVGIHESLAYPEGIAYEARTGDIIVADSENDRILRIKPDRSAELVAGAYTVGSCEVTGGCSCPTTPPADGSQASAAALCYPENVAVDAAGNVFISDWGARVYRVSAGGRIDTVAGGGACCPSPPSDPVVARGYGLGAVAGLAMGTSNDLFISSGSMVWRLEAPGSI